MGRTIASKLAAFGWYLRDRDRIAALPALMRRVLLPHPGERTGDEAAARCAAQSVSLAEALNLLAPGYAPVNFADIHAEALAQAQSRCEACPVEMGGPGNLDLLFNLAEALKARAAVETGVAYGWSTLALLLSLSRRAGGRLVSIDRPYPNAGNEPYVAVAAPQDLRGQWTLIAKPDRIGLPQALRMLGPVDLCHYDSDKSYAGRMFAYPRLWAALRPGGMLVSDDIADNLAFHDFARRAGAQPVVIGSGAKFAGVLLKPD